MSKLNEDFSRELLEMRAEDSRVREKLAETGELFDGYHKEMEAVHLKNARKLEEMLVRAGVEWFGKSTVGEAAAEAAWLIVQHAISRPDLSRRMLPVLEKQAAQDEVPLWQVAYLEDRTNSLTGKPQRFGSQFGWNARGEMEPRTIFEPEKIDSRRAAYGLATPYSEYIEKQIQAVRESNEPKPKDSAKREQEFLEWARKTGWRE